MEQKGLLFDFWGTVMENGVYPSPVSQVRFFLRIRDVSFHEYIIRFEKVFMTKEYDSLTSGFRAVCKEFQVNPPDWVIDKMVGMWNKNRLLAKPFPEAIETLYELKKHYKLGLISNTDAFSIEPLIEKFELNKIFDNVTLSYKEGMLKVDKGLYDIAVQRMGIPSHDIVMVGDSIESDIESARNAGIRAVLIDRRDKREYSERIATLSELGGFLG